MFPKRSPRLLPCIAAFWLAIVFFWAPATAEATVWFKFNPATSNQWQPGSNQVIAVQVRSDDGDVLLGGLQVDFTYDNSTSGIQLGSIDSSYVDSGQMSEDYTDDTDDGAASLFRAVTFVGGGDDGFPVSGQWLTIADLNYTVTDSPVFPQFVEVTLYAALDKGFGTLDTRWEGSPVGGEYTNSTTAIELVSLSASENNGNVKLSWETATERANAGFHLLRASTNNGDYQRITPSLIPTEGSEFSGAEYTFTDSDVSAGNTYFYKLEDIDLSGHSTFHGPVSQTLSEDPLFNCGLMAQSDNLLAILFMAFLFFLTRQRTNLKR